MRKYFAIAFAMLVSGCALQEDTAIVDSGSDGTWDVQEPESDPGDIYQPEYDEVFDCYLDYDGDGYGNGNEVVDSVDGECPVGYVEDGTDWCDGNNTQHTQAGCGSPTTVTCYLDNDGDGYGNGNVSQVVSGSTCPTGYVANGNDYCDGNASQNTQTGCAGTGSTVTCYTDVDGDGHGAVGSAQSFSGSTCPSGYSSTDGDYCDNNASQWTSSGCSGSNTITCYRDADGDGHGAVGSATNFTATSCPSGYVSVDGDYCDTNSQQYTQTGCTGTATNVKPCIKNLKDRDVNGDYVVDRLKWAKCWLRNETTGNNDRWFQGLPVIDQAVTSSSGEICSPDESHDFVARTTDALEFNCDVLYTDGASSNNTLPSWYVYGLTLSQTVGDVRIVDGQQVCDWISPNSSQVSGDIRCD